MKKPKAGEQFICRGCGKPFIATQAHEDLEFRYCNIDCAIGFQSERVKEE